jgi:hypothetical protein
VVARTLAPGGMIRKIQHAILEIDKTVNLEARSMRDATSLEFSLRRMGTWILGIIGLLGLALALVGLYGVMSYTVNRRSRRLESVSRLARRRRQFCGRFFAAA